MKVKRKRVVMYTTKKRNFLLGKIYCFFNKKGHKISTHNRRCMRCNYKSTNERATYL
jgi:hypothetical protein